jgi:hypothetical protein
MIPNLSKSVQIHKIHNRQNEKRCLLLSLLSHKNTTFSSIVTNMKFFLYNLSFFALLAQLGQANQIKGVLGASADTSLRKDRQYQNYGTAQHITVTKDSAKNARVALVKFDTANVSEDDAAKALLRLYIADVDGLAEQRTVLIKRVNNNFDENDVSWNNYDVSKEGQEWIEFHIHNDHVGKIGQVDVTSLMVPGKNLSLAIHTSDRGHVKFASKEHSDSASHPKLLLVQQHEL